MDKPRGYWTEERCLEEAKKYKTKKDFRGGSYSAYIISCRNRWLDEYVWLDNTEVRKWTYEACKEAALKYTRRVDFQRGSNVAYGVSLRNGWLDEYEWLEDPVTKKKWTSESCKKVAMKYNSVSEFLKHDKVAYNVACKNGWIKEYDWLERKIKSRGFWNYEHCKEEAEKYPSRLAFQKACIGAYKVARLNGWLDDFFVKKVKK